MLQKRLLKLSSVSQALRKLAARGMGNLAAVERQATFKNLQSNAAAEHAATKAAPTPAPTPVQTKSAPVAAASKAAPAAKPGVMGRIADHFGKQVGKHGVLPVAASVAGGAMLASGAAKVPSNYRKFKAGFRPENHPYH